MRLSAVILLGLCGCGERPCDFVESGICVNAGPFVDVTPELVGRVVFELEGAAVYVLGHGLDIETHAERADLYVKYARLSAVEEKCGEEYNGCYFPEDREVFVGVEVGSNDPEQCYVKRFVLGHEILHFVDHEILLSDEDLTNDHMVPKVWGKWATRQGFEEPYDKSIEGLLIQYARGECAR